MDYENPFIKVTWEDTPENFTTERLKRVKSYFKKKYGTPRVNVITKVVETDNSKGSLDVGDKILDPAYQDTLVKDFLEDQEVTIDWDKLKRLDNKVEEHLLENAGIEISNRKWDIKWIEFSNFLSFGEDNIINFTNLGGITAIDSNPSNFGGKTTVSVDLLLFLFFNTTTKSTKAIEVFNRFTDKNRVLVRGEVEIDGDNYIIERGIVRKLTKKGEWSVKTELNFSKKLSNNTLQNLQGEQRRETEEIIKNSIGSVDDFLLTILATGNNLEELIESKPTQRGQILTRFIGLERLKEKEVICKEMYSNWSKKLISNIYNIVDLETDNETLTEEIKNNTLRIEEVEVLLISKEKEIKVEEGVRDEVAASKYTTIDTTLLTLDPKELKREMGVLEEQVLKNKKELETIVPESPKKEYDENAHNTLKESLNEKTINLKVLEKNIIDDKKFIEELKKSEICPTCKRPLDDVNHQDEIKNKLTIITSSENSVKEGKKEIDNLQTQVNIHKETMDGWREFERSKLKKTKYELQLQDVEIKLRHKKEKLELWTSNEKRLKENREIEQKMVTLRTKIDSLYAERDNLKNEVTNLKAVNLTHTNKIKENNNNISKIKAEEEIDKIFKSYLIAYGKNGISKIVLRNTIPYINGELNRLLSESALFSMELKLNDRNELEFWMKDNDTNVEKLLSSGSGYERTIASLALRAVLAKVCSLPKPNIVCFDEVFGKVSDENLELIGNFFIKIKDYFDKILVITHNSLVKEWCDNNITIKKVNNVSSISGTETSKYGG